MHAVRLVAAVVLGAPVAMLSAQVDVENLRAPSVPAFTILGIAPTEVARPTSGRALGLWLLNSGIANGSLPANLALELAPFWLQSRPAVGINSLYGDTAQKWHTNIQRSVAQSFSLSLASAAAATESDSAGPALGIGARANLFAGRPRANTRTIVTAFEGKLAECAVADGDDIDSVPDAAARERGRQLVQACYDNLADDRTKVEASLAPIGWLVEVAAASSFVGGTGADDAPTAAQIAAWVAPTYVTEDGFEFAALLRWTQDRSLTENPVAFDAGARLTWRLSDDLALSAEGVAKDPGTDAVGYSNRWSAMLEYRLPIGALLYYSAGRDFKNASGIAPTFARFGLTMGLGAVPVVTASK